MIRKMQRVEKYPYIHSFNSESWKKLKPALHQQKERELLS